MKVTLQFFHKTSPSFKDVQGPYEASPEDFATLEAARKWFKRHRITLGKVEWRREGRRVLFFPRSRSAASWHAIVVRPGASLRLKGGEIQKMAQRLREQGYSQPMAQARKLYRMGHRLEDYWTEEPGALGHRAEGGHSRTGRRSVFGVKHAPKGVWTERYGMRDPATHAYPRVMLLKGSTWPASGWKAGKYYYLVGETTRGGMMLQDEDRPSREGETSVLLSKTPRGGALWFLKRNVRPVRGGRRKRS